MIDTRSFDIRLDGSILTIVPAVHYRVLFAETVNAIACNAETRPDAIAVEMGPVLATAVVDWLREIGLSPDTSVSLPSLLGLETRQRYLSPSVREEALELQIESGRELADLPPEVLDLELNYRASCLVPLTPTDSIVEAIRCGVELNVPIHGVDLDEVAPVERQNVLLPDPSVATGRVASYAKEAAAMIAALDVSTVDQRRDLAMAARLKGLMQSYRRVLFTCGLAHWQRVARLIRDPKLKPALDRRPFPEASDLSRYHRKVIHPTLGFQFLDRMPIVAQLFERRRRHPLLDHPNRTGEAVSVPALFEAKLRHGIRAYLRAHRCATRENEVDAVQLDVVAEFPRLVMRHAAFGLSDVPPITGVLRCAQAFMGDGFAATVARVMLRFPWADEKEFRDCETLLPSDTHTGASHIRITQGRGVLAEPTRVRGLSELEWVGWSDDRSHKSGERRDKSRKSGGAYCFTWTPWEHLVTGLSDEGVGLACRVEARPVVEPFRGSIQRGIAPRETLRARAREGGFYVHRDRPLQTPGPTDASEGWPVVWLFDSESAADSSWTHYFVPVSWLVLSARDKASFACRYANTHGQLSALIAFGDLDPRPTSDVSVFMLRGLILYSPVFADNRQYTCWVELTAGTRNPFFSRTHPSGIPTPVWSHCKSLGHPVGELAWQDDIVRMAIPFSGRHVTVIRPKHYTLHPVVYKEAAQMGRRLAFVDLDHFSQDEIERARRHLSVAGHTNGHGTTYSPSAEAAIGEGRGRYAQRMPDKWRRFGL